MWLIPSYGIAVLNKSIFLFQTHMEWAEAMKTAITVLTEYQNAYIMWFHNTDMCKKFV
jgi:hypothetical protein